jgi:tetratricopeptide (TPR) repeat protein
LEKTKEDEEAYNKIGLCFYKLRQYSQAADYFSKAIDINNKVSLYNDN